MSLDPKDIEHTLESLTAASEAIAGFRAMLIGQGFPQDVADRIIVASLERGSQ